MRVLLIGGFALFATACGSSNSSTELMRKHNQLAADLQQCWAIGARTELQRQACLAMQSENREQQRRSERDQAFSSALKAWGHAQLAGTYQQPAPRPPPMINCTTRPEGINTRTTCTQW